MTRGKRKKKALQRQGSQQQNDAKKTPQIAPPAIVNSTGVEQAADAGRANSAAQDQHKGEKPSPTDRYAFWQAVFSLCIVIFTAGQVIVGYWQWDATRDQYNAMLLDQRPWVSIEAQVLEAPRARKPIMCRFVMHNSGRSAGTILEQSAALLYMHEGDDFRSTGSVKFDAGRTEVKVANEVLRVLEAPRPDDRTSTAVAPDRDVTINISDMHPNVSDDALAELEAGKIVCVILGHIVYLGSDGSQFSTRSCYVYDSGTGLCLPSDKYNYMK